jgi:hypothetical protein
MAERHQPAALAAVQVQRARLSLDLDLPVPVHLQPVRRVHRQRPADHGLLQGRTAVPHLRRLPRDQVRRLPGPDGFPRSLHPGGDRRQRLGAVAADPLRSPRGQLRAAEPRALAARLHAELGRGLRALHGRRRRHQLRRGQPQLAGHRRPGPRRGRPADLRLPHLGAVRAHTDDPVIGHRRGGGRRAGLLRRLDRSCCSSASSRSGTRSRRSTC